MRAQAVIADSAVDVAGAVLAWYDDHARTLPWRIGPAARRKGIQPDPYRVWLSEIMLQQTTTATVAPRFADFLARWPTVEALAAAPIEDVLGQWAGLGYYARARNLHKCARHVAETLGGEFPDTEEALSKLPGIGAYTAAAIAAIAFGRPAVVVDGNIERVVARLFAIETPLPAAKPLLKEKAASLWPRRRSGDFAQALMDLGATVCRPRNPECSACPLSLACAAYAQSDPAGFPVRAPKKNKPTRRGGIFVVFNKARAVLVEKRPEKGLLGAMLGFPGTPWEDKTHDAFDHAPARAGWRCAGQVAHTFTHFHLRLDVYCAAAPPGFRRRAGQQWIAPEAARLPTVMKKVLTCALQLDGDLNG